LLAGFEANPGPRNAAIRRSRCLPQRPESSPQPPRVPLGDRPVTAIRTPLGRACWRPWDRACGRPWDRAPADAQRPPCGTRVSR